MNDRLNNIELNDSSLRYTSKLHIYFRTDGMNSMVDMNRVCQNDSRLVPATQRVQYVEMNAVNDDSNDDKNNEGNAETMILKGLDVQ
jgi:hypothetical protein